MFFDCLPVIATRRPQSIVGEDNALDAGALATLFVLPDVTSASYRVQRPAQKPGRECPVFNWSNFRVARNVARAAPRRLTSPSVDVREGSKMKPSSAGLGLVSPIHSEMYSPARRYAVASDIKDRLRNVGLRPTRTRVALAYMLFGQGNRHVTAEMLFEEASRAKVSVALATIYNTLHEFTKDGFLRQVATIPQSHILIPTTQSTTTIIWKIGTS
jgi:Ferric uptake regulator family